MGVSGVDLCLWEINWLFVWSRPKQKVLGFFTKEPFQRHRCGNEGCGRSPSSLCGTVPTSKHQGTHRGDVTITHRGESQAQLGAERPQGDSQERPTGRKYTHRTSSSCRCPETQGPTSSLAASAGAAPAGGGGRATLGGCSGDSPVLTSGSVGELALFKMGEMMSKGLLGSPSQKRIFYSLENLLFQLMSQSKPLFGGNLKDINSGHCKEGKKNQSKCGADVQPSARTRKGSNICASVRVIHGRSVVPGRKGTHIPSYILHSMYHTHI